MGLVVIAVATAWVLYVQRGAHLDPKGKIMKVRTLALDETSSLAVIDFRVANHSDVGIQVRQVTMTLEDRSGRIAEGMVVSEVDAKRLFQYYPLLGEKYNDTLILRDRIGPRQTVDKMVAARFEMPLAQLDARKSFVVRVEDVDGPVGELTEAR